ncbi:MarR family transcriptional regulator [Modestobacter sp. I12A-02628]|uniref:MarR family transcriptional regulator n=2 Tax=Goekera deserti TaxID=2497753 RepID=A0A7K3WKI6_9ACTN|nr:MarR family transcriptional regulator [Goekera deserti]NDI48442.1 MarR family transcriptional regulator [Goekera deserti]NEL56043.1 MarR family transcriptional regulator [Goekera deserti]
MTLLRRFAVETDRYVESSGTQHDLHRTDLNALAVILDANRAGEPLTPSRLGAALHLSSPATTALLDRLERAGHVRRTRSTVDRRRVDLEMTRAAGLVAGELFGPLGRSVGAAVERYGPEERALVARFLRDVIAATVAARQTPTPPS